MTNATVESIQMTEIRTDVMKGGTAVALNSSVVIASHLQLISEVLQVISLGVTTCLSLLTAYSIIRTLIKRKKRK